MSKAQRTKTARLRDILEAIEQIRADTTGMDMAEFLSDKKTRNSVVFGLLLIGEATAEYRDELSRDAPNVPWHRIVGLRNQLIHGYFSVDDQAVWVVATEHLKPLEEAVQNLLSALES